jgi:hypothetical protein
MLSELQFGLNSYIMGDSFFDNFLRIFSLNENFFYVIER